ncbi:ABC transporter substrate-binding protein [Haliangium sp.]|uniref:ABC transporter substrate-binding protein n=1 Tax=Haliangium sp. TaxID=2663208 RepID=UPI003D118D44
MTPALSPRDRRSPPLTPNTAGARRARPLRLLWAGLGLAALGLVLGRPAAPLAAPAPTAGARTGGDDIRVGMSAALSGPTGSLGRDMRLGIELHFTEVNRAGGVAGRALRLIALDDGYVPEVAADNMRRLIEREQVVAVIGNVGTPTAEKTVPIARAAGTLLFAPFTGASLLYRRDTQDHVLTYRASYAEETATMIQHLLAIGVRPYEIAFFTQHDGFGDDGYRGAMTALEAAGYDAARELPHGRYERNTLDIEDALLTILDAENRPRAIIMIGAYAPCAKFIRVIRRRLPNTVFMVGSFVGSTALADALGPHGEGVIVTQVVPNIDDSSLPVVRDYHRALAEQAPQAEPSFVSLEGYIAARVFVEGLRRAPTPLTRAGVTTALAALCEVDVGLGDGARIDYCDRDRQASHRVWPTALTKDGHFAPVDWDALARTVQAWRTQRGH